VLIAIRRSFLALLCCGAAYAAYAALLVPWLEPARADKGEPRSGTIAGGGSGGAVGASGAGGAAGVSTAAPTTPFEALIARHFPPEAWQTQRPKVAEYDGYVFLFRDYRQLPDGAVELKPCTLVILPKGFDDSAAGGSQSTSIGGDSRDGVASATGGVPPANLSVAADGFTPGESGSGKADTALTDRPSSKPDAPVIVAAEGGALLQFDGDTAAARGRFGRFLGGRLPGEVRVTRPESFPGAGDAMSLTTRNIQIDAQRIWTPHDVQFRYGASYGSGRDLVVTLAPPVDPAANASVVTVGDSTSDGGGLGGGSGNEAAAGFAGGVAPLGLPESSTAAGGTAAGGGGLERLPGVGGFLPNASDSKPSAAQGKPQPLSGAALQGVKFIELVHLEKLHLETSRQREGLLGGPGDAPVEIRCQGSFRMDIQERIVSFDDRVEVQRLRSDGEGDQLTCQVLLLHFDRVRARTGEFAPERLVATGNPVLLHAPAMGARARGARLEYLLERRLIHLEDPQGAVLEQAQQRLEAPQVQYQLAADPSGLGRAWASGPGRLTRVDPAGGALETTWRQELRLRPQDDLHVLSLRGGTTIQMPGMGRFEAETLHAWLREVSSDRRSKEIQPDRLLAQGSVRFQSPRLSGETRELQAWFRPDGIDERVPPGRVSSVGGDSGVSDNSRDGGEQVGNGGSPGRTIAYGGSSSNDPPVDPADALYLEGDLLRLRLRFSAARTRLDQVAVSGNVRVRQAGTGDSPEPRLKVTGDELNIEDADTSAAHLSVRGTGNRLAQVTARSLTLDGREIQVHQGENRLWIDGAGQMSFPPLAPRAKPMGELLFQNRQPLGDANAGGSDFGGANGAGPYGANPNGANPEGGGLDGSGPNGVGPGGVGAIGGAPRRPPPITVAWKGRMDFDGQTARFQRDVQVRGTQRLESGELLEVFVLGGLLDVSLSHRLSFAGGAAPPDLALGAMTFGGHIYVEGRTTQSGLVTATHRLQMHNLTIDQASGRLHGDGPGWLSTVRLEEGQQGISPTAVPGSSVPVAAPRLVYLHVEFSRAVDGNLNARHVEFSDQVQAIFGPVARWEDELDWRNPEAAGEQGAGLKCERLAVGQLSGGEGGSPAVELEATGSAVVEGLKFLARGARISYSQAKDLLLLAGDGRSDAEFYRKPRANPLKPDTVARTIMYWRRDNRLEISGGRYIDLSPYTSDLLRGGRKP
jgi:hypothetical protein